MQIAAISRSRAPALSIYNLLMTTDWSVVVGVGGGWFCAVTHASSFTASWLGGCER